MLPSIAVRGADDGATWWRVLRNLWFAGRRAKRVHRLGLAADAHEGIVVCASSELPSHRHGSRIESVVVLAADKAAPMMAERLSGLR
jgi:hypothetical protein